MDKRIDNRKRLLHVFNKAGDGTTGVVALRLHRKFRYRKNSDTFEMAKVCIMNSVK